MHFHSGAYEKSLADFTSALESKAKTAEEAEAESDGSSRTDLSDVGLCALNAHEAAYNRALCLIMMRDLRRAVFELGDVIERAQPIQSRGVYLLRGVILQALGEGARAKEDFEAATQHDPETTQRLLRDRQAVTVNAFSSGTRLCAQFPAVKLAGLSPGGAAVSARLSFSFPFIKPPNMIPSVDERVLSREFDVADFCAPKPEAPWIKRCGFGIKFTDEIRYTEYSVSEPEGSPEKSERRGSANYSGEGVQSPGPHRGRARVEEDVTEGELEGEEEEEEEEEERAVVRGPKAGVLMGLSCSERVLKNREELCFSEAEGGVACGAMGEIVVGRGVNETSIVNDSTLEIVEQVKKGLAEGQKAGMGNVTLDLEKEEEEEADEYGEIIEGRNRIESREGERRRGKK